MNHRCIVIILMVTQILVCNSYCSSSNVWSSFPTVAKRGNTSYNVSGSSLTNDVESVGPVYLEKKSTNFFTSIVT